MAAMNDPKLAQLMGQNPMAQQMHSAAMAHISEHVAFQYRKDIEKQLGADMPSMEEKLSPEVEVQLSTLVAQAADQLLKKNSAETAQQKIQQAQQDPLIQMQQQELQIKAQTMEQNFALDQMEAKRKAQKDLMDAAAKADEIRLKEESLRAKSEHDGTRLGVDVAKAKDAASRQDQKDGMRMGIEIAKHKAEKEKNDKGNVLPLHQPEPPKGV